MHKAADLRAALVSAYPDLAKNPDRLLMFTETGSTLTRQHNRSFQINYDLNIVLLDWTGHIALLMLTLNDWLRRNEPDLVAPPNADAYPFNVDIIDEEKSDIQFTLKLTEQVQVRPNDQGGDDLCFLAPVDINEMVTGQGLADPVSPLTTVSTQGEIVAHIDDMPVIHPGMFNLSSYDRGQGFGYATALNPDYTEANPLILTAGSRIQIPVSGPVLDELSGLFAGHDYLGDGKFQPRAIHDLFDLRLTVTGKSSLLDASLTVEMDIGGDQGVIDSDQANFPLAAGSDGRLVFKYMDFARETFLANGATFFGIASKDAEIWDIQLLFLPRGAASVIAP